MSNIKTIKGYKAMNADMTCRGHKFKEGKTYKLDSISMCSSGFHFCKNFFDVYSYYPKDENTVVCEIEAIGKVLKENDKSVTDEIKIVKKLTEKELLALHIKNNNSGNRNSGDGNSGNRNSGYRNSGDGNSGNRNSGYRNSGDGNSGYRNSGDGNSGNRNSGDGNSGYGNSGNRNSGDGNSGYGNSGNRNSGDWNSGDGNSGYFNTKVPVYFFNKPSDTEYTEELEIKLRSINVKPILEWIGESLMNDTEKNNNPSYKTTGGFLRKTDRHDFRSLTENDKKLIKSLPNFDDTIFKIISNGVSLNDDVEVLVNGKTKVIPKADAQKLGLID